MHWVSTIHVRLISRLTFYSRACKGTWLGLLGVLFLTAQPALATLPPETYPLVPHKGEPLIDSNLSQWFSQFESIPDYLSLNTNDFKNALVQLSPLERDILEMIRSDGKQKKALVGTKISSLEAISREMQHDPLYPYFIEELANTPGIPKDQLQRLRSEIRNFGGNSCPQKDLLLNDISDSHDGFKTTAEASAMLQRITGFQSDGYRSRALDEFLDVLNESHREALKPELLTLVAPYAKLKQQYDWLRGTEDTQSVKIKPSVEDGNYRNIMQLAAKGQCSDAKSQLVKISAQSVAKKSWEIAQKAALRIDQCYRPKGLKARTRFYAAITPLFRKTYGLKGYAFAHGKHGSLLWGNDEFEPAKKLFEALLKETQAAKDAELEASTLHTLGRIFENEGDMSKALEYFQALTTKFPSATEFGEAAKSIVLIASNIKKPELAEEFAEKLILRESQKKVDERDTTVLSFALFWAGRLSYETQKIDQAERYWHRGATEFYSTFYGAMSHYLLEQLTSSSYMLQPSWGSPFLFEELVASLDPSSQKTVQRSMSLLKIGLKDAAKCEIKELAANERNAHVLTERRKVLLKSMLQHVSGDWLESIRTYQNLPRTFRHALAPGFERILFPRNYGEYIHKYSTKLGVDPELVYAIIRQESVFNPNAVSSAGARGLMQLMPATAKQEAKRLASDYVEGEVRRKLIEKSKNKTNLLEAHTNVTIGVHHVQTLLDTFKNPIFVLTSYNASPRATRRWMKRFAQTEDLEFIERIPYKETKEYVMLVLRNYFYYKRWYQPSHDKLPLIDQIMPASLRNMNRGQQQSSSATPLKPKG